MGLRSYVLSEDGESKVGAFAYSLGVRAEPLKRTAEEEAESRRLVRGESFDLKVGERVLALSYDDFEWVSISL